MAPSGQEESEYGNLAGAANFGTSQGESDILKAQNFWSSILSGDMSKISQVLGPQISAINKQGQQKKKTMFEFGNRGGGTNSAAQSIDSDTTSAVNDMISKLTASSASNLGSTGSSLFGAGVSADTSAFEAADVMHGENAAKWNDIFQSIGGLTGGAGSFFPAGSGIRKLWTALEGTLDS